MLEIRRAVTEADAEAILEIDGLTFKDCHVDTKEILNILREDYPAYVAWQDGKAVGYLCLMHVHTLHYRGCWVDLVAVLPDWQKRGIAKALIQQGMTHAAEAGAEFLSALVRKGNKASLAAFEHHGFLAANDGFDLMIREFGDMKTSAQE